MDLNNKIIKATKWSLFTEIFAKLIVPVTNMILARVLAPEAFGVIATITMVISFADLFVDAGFQKYLVQKEFEDDKERFLENNIAFWTNILISLFLWGIIAFFSEDIANILGTSGLGKAISIACIQLPLTSFSSIQMSIYRREFEFKSLFLVRLIGVLTTLLITIPLAKLGLGYWALIIGNICGQVFNVVFLTIKSKWKPKLIYDLKVLKKMISFSIWSLIEAISIWFTTWIDAFIIARFLNQYYLGLYKNSVTIVNSLMAIITGSIMPVLFSSLSRLQNDEKSFKNMYYNVQKYVAYIIFPMALGSYIYRDFITDIMLGSKWVGASDIIGIWILTSAIVIVYSNFNSEVYRAKGRPKLSFISQVIHLIFLVPTCLITLKHDFWTFVYWRSLIRLQGAIVDLIIIRFVMKFSIKKIFSNTFKPMLCTIIMGLIALFLRTLGNNFIWNLLSIIICVIFYLFATFIISFKDFQEIKKIIY